MAARQDSPTAAAKGGTMSSSNESPCGNPPIVADVESNSSTNARSKTPNSSGTPATMVGVEIPPPPLATDAPPATGIDEVLDTSKLKSEVWKHFKRILKANGDIKAVCNLCSKYLNAATNNGTSHLKEHVIRCPKRKIKDIRQMLLTKNLNGDLSKARSQRFDSQDEGRKALAFMIILHEYPLCIVEHVGFRQFVYVLQPLFKCPSRNTVKSDILKIYLHEKKELKRLIDDTESRIAITSDMWTSSNQKKGFMVVTAHFIDDGWNIRSYILRFVYVPCPHTSEVLAQALLDTLLAWDIDTKVSTITLDNCSTNDALMDFMKHKLSSDHLMWSGSKLHIRCCAHILNLIIKDGLDVIKKIIERIRESVQFWTATPKRKENFELLAKNSGICYGRALSLDCSTRWNSTYLMLTIALSYQDVFPRLKLREPLYKSLPSESDWRFAKKVCEKLEVFYEVTELFSGSKYPTSNLFFEKVCDIKVGISDWLLDDDLFIRDMAASMMTKFEKYWGSIHDVLAIAAVFDPRYKFTLLECYFPNIYGEEAKGKIEAVQKLIVDLEKEYKNRSTVNVGNNVSVTESVKLSSQSGAKMSAYDRYVASLQASQEEVETELDGYIEERVLPKTTGFDILLWWKANASKYPILALIARDILAIPVTTVASESAFSSGGRLVSPCRSRLLPDIVEALMCAQNWLFNANVPGILISLSYLS